VGFLLILLLIAILLIIFAAVLIGKIIGIILFLIIAALCGAVAEYVLHQHEGLGVTLLIGLIGAALGAIIAHLFHLPSLLQIAGVQIVWTIVGAIIVVAILRLVRPPRKRLGLFG
jgi:uncharacterized membrane protein YeaQ/YmgE (transglycosylase-associated protein family)